jgi:hypothetical protein
VLAGAGLGDQALTPGPFGQQPLSKRVVQLVGTAVEEVLMFEVDIRVVPFAQRLGVKHRCRSSTEVFEQVLESSWNDSEATAASNSLASCASGSSSGSGT